MVKRGKTPVLSAAEARQLLDSIESNTLIGLRDRALINIMVCSFARGRAAVAMKVSDFFEHRQQRWLRLHEKGGERHEMPCHPQLAKYLQAWLAAAGIAREKKEPLFPSVGKGERLGDNGLSRFDMFQMNTQRISRPAIPS